MNIAYPYRFDRRGRTADADIAAHLHDLIEQVLFTAPGERVMRPSFGSGINALVFAPGGDTLATAVQSTVQAALQQWLGDRAQVVSVTAESDDSRLHVEVRYAPLHIDVIETTRFTRIL